MSAPSPPRGRGSRLNPDNRYADWQREGFDDGWQEATEDEAPATQLLVERSRSVISRNTSPDVPFSQSINPYKVIPPTYRYILQGDGF